MKYLILVALFIASVYGGLAYFGQSNGVGGGSGTINQLSLWFFDGTNITQNTASTTIKLTGYESSGDCLVTDASGVVSTASCGTGSGTSTNNGLSTTTPFTTGDLVRVVNGGIVQSIATSSLGLPTFSSLDFYLTTTTAAATYYLASNPNGYTNNTGTVTSVGQTVPTGFSIAGSPVTTTGTLAISYAAGYGAILTASTTEWHNFHTTPSGRITAGNHIDWTGNTLDVVTSGDWTGTIDGNNFAGGAIGAGDMLYGSGAGTLAELTIGASSSLLYSNGSTPAWGAASSLCILITGSAALCDGDDASGAGGGGSISTSTTPIPGQVAFWTSASALSSVATGTLTTTATGTQLSATRGLLGGSAILSWLAGYDAVRVASTTEWSGFYNTPSGRITAGTGIDWTGNTLNGVYTAGDALTLTGEDFDFDGGTSPGGSLGGTWASPTIDDLFLFNNGDVGTGAYDFGGATTFEIPNGAAPTATGVGEVGHDTSDNQLILDDFVIPTTFKLAGRTIASTSVAFLNGATMPLSTQLDGFTITRIQCSVESGTSKIIAIEDASGNASEDITCATTVTTDDGSITNATYTAAEEWYIDFGATSGAVDYVNISVFGTWTRE